MAAAASSGPKRTIRREYETIYCSEPVWKAYQLAAKLELGALKKLRDFDLGSRVVEQKLQERYGENVPYDMTVIPPA
jgi:hypothetical protein